MTGELLAKDIKDAGGIITLKVSKWQCPIYNCTLESLSDHVKIRYAFFKLLIFISGFSAFLAEKKFTEINTFRA